RQPTLRLPPAPRRTLFPYTTPFRSLAGAAASNPANGFAGSKPVTAGVGFGSAAGAGGGVGKANGLSGNPGATGSRAAGSRPDLRDRKSTRLNSSHQISSYAVFCLHK